MGEGLRNTISLRGRSGAQGFLHWSANFDEVQDFEGQIRGLAGGTGLMSDAAFNAGTRSQPLGDAKAGQSADLDALAAYVASLSSFANSPRRNNDGTLTAAAIAGRDVFASANCAQCHSGTAFTNSAAANLNNIGTIRQPGSGNRLGGPLTGIDAPTLRDVWATAPYLHDGSAATIAAAITAHSGVTISGTEPDEPRRVRGADRCAGNLRADSEPRADDHQPGHAEQQHGCRGDLADQRKRSGRQRAHVQRDGLAGGPHDQCDAPAASPERRPRSE